MRLTLAIFLILPCAIRTQFFNQQNDANRQRFNQNPSINSLDPYHLNQRPNGQQGGGIMRPNPAHVYNTPNEHPIFNLMQNQQNRNHQLEVRQQPSFQHPNQSPVQQSHLQNQSPVQQSHLQNQSPVQQSSVQQSHLQNQPNQAHNSQQQQPFRPRSFNRLSNQVNQWTGSNGINSPGIFTNPTRNSSPYNSGAIFYIQLTSYSNERLAMKGGNTCYCPREECTILDNIRHPCYFTFTIVVASSSGEPVHYISKQFVVVNNTGIPSPAEGDWTVPVTLNMVSKPTYIDIFVNNLGPVIQGRQVNYLDEFWQVDTFTIDLSDYRPSIANSQPSPVTTRLNGQLVGSNLEVSYYVQCQAGLLGDNCDLQCSPTKKQEQPARSICTSRITNTTSICTLDNNRAQVQNCQICGYGVLNDQCADLAHFEGQEVGVSSAFRVWTIVLGVLLAIAIIFILILIIMYVIAERKLREQNAEEQRAQNRRSNGNGNRAYDNRRVISDPLLVNDEWSKPSRPPHAFVHPGVESESTHSDSVPRPGNIASTSSAFQPQQNRREAQV